MTTLARELNRTLKIAWPLTLGLLGQQFLGLIDSIMVGHHSTVELAAAAFVNSLCGAPLVIIFGFTTNIGVLVAQAVGRNGGGQAGRILRHGFVLNLTIALILMLALGLLNQHLELFSQPADVTAHAHSFLHYISMSLLPLALFNAFRQFSDGLQITLPPMLITVFGVILNTTINWFLIFGHSGAPEMGLAGAGIATLISRWVMLIILFIVIVRDERYKKYIGGLWGRTYEMAIFSRNFGIGAPSDFQYLFESGAFYAVAIMMGWIGTSTLAANQIVMSLVALLYMFPLSISIATSVRVGEATGRKDPFATRVIGFSSLYLSFAVTFICALILFFGRLVLPLFFTGDLDVIHITGDLFVIAGFFQIFDGTQCVLVGALRGMSDVKVPTAWMFFAYWVVGISLAYGCGFTLHYGYLGIWTGLALSVVISALGLTYRFDRISSRHIHNSKNSPLAETAP